MARSRFCKRAHGPIARNTLSSNANDARERSEPIIGCKSGRKKRDGRQMGLFMLSDPFEGPKLKGRTDKRHITDYRLAFKAFAEANVIEGVPQTDVKTRKPELAFAPLPPTPSEMRLCAADSLYNLRSALDQAVCRCARLRAAGPMERISPMARIKRDSKSTSVGKNERKFPIPCEMQLPPWSHTMEGTAIFSEFFMISMWSINTPISLT